jgi:drug/metabolite transporter (DMT)-like permease
LLPSGYATGTRALLGLLCACGALAAWTWYAVSNSRWLAHLHDVSAHDWSLLTGVVTGALALALVPFALLGDTAHHASGDWLRFGGISAALALLASITGNALWNRMSRLLPLTLVGQMILFETLFALIYGFVWEHRLPTPLEALAFVLLVGGVVTCVLAHGRVVDPVGAES